MNRLSRHNRAGPPELIDRVRLVNCARCRCQLLGPSMIGYQRIGPYTGLFSVHAWLPDPERVDHQRPYCAGCVEIETRRRGREH